MKEHSMLNINKNNSKYCCFNNLTSTKLTAFTLAEVLVTLGIIGIVAAITIPSLITNYQEKYQRHER